MSDQTPTQVNKSIVLTWFHNAPDKTPLPKNRIGLLAAHLNAVCGSEFRRHAFVNYIYGKESLNDLLPEQVNRLWEWLAVKPSGQDGEGRTIFKARAVCPETVTMLIGDPPRQESFTEIASLCNCSPFYDDEAGMGYRCETHQIKMYVDEMPSECAEGYRLRTQAAQGVTP